MSNLLDDFADLEPFAREVNRNHRTVRRWMNQPDGLPYTRIGNRILIHIPTAREWIFKRMRKPAERRTTRPRAPALANSPRDDRQKRRAA